MLNISQNLHMTANPDVKIVKLVPKPLPSESESSKSESKPDYKPDSGQPRTTIGTGGSRQQLRSSLMKQLGVNYRWSSIVVDDRGDAGEEAKLTAYGIEGVTDVRAGDRAPDAGLLVWGDAEKRTTLHAPGVYMPTKHTALVFIPGDISEADIKDAIISVTDTLRPHVEEDLFQVYIVADSSTSAEDYASLSLPMLVDDRAQARTAYGIPSDKSPTVVIVRPDEVVGAFVFGVEGVKKYIGKVFY